jgi:hypothetical protein
VRASQRSLVVKAQKREMMMWEALREGLDEEMERDPTVCLMGACVAGWTSSSLSVAAQVFTFRQCSLQQHVGTVLLAGCRQRCH